MDLNVNSKTWPNQGCHLLNSLIYDLKRSVDLRWLFDPVLHSFLDYLVFSLRREDCQIWIKIVSRIIQIVIIHDHQAPHRPLGSGLLLRHQGCCPGPIPDPTIFCKYLQILTNICKYLQIAANICKYVKGQTHLKKGLWSLDL